MSIYCCNIKKYCMNKSYRIKTEVGIGTEEAINDAQPIKTWVMVMDTEGLTTSGDRLDRMIREKKFQDKINVDFSIWFDWKKEMDKQ